MKKITLDLPPVINQTYKSGQGKFYKSAEATRWLRDAKYLIKSQYKDKPISNPIFLFLDFYFKTDADIDSRIKATLDALQGILYVNDSLVIKLNVTKKKDKNARVEITWF